MKEPSLIAQSNVPIEFKSFGVHKKGQEKLLPNSPILTLRRTYLVTVTKAKLLCCSIVRNFVELRQRDCRRVRLRAESLDHYR